MESINRKGFPRRKNSKEGSEDNEDEAAEEPKIGNNDGGSENGSEGGEQLPKLGKHGIVVPYPSPGYVEEGKIMAWLHITTQLAVRYGPQFAVDGGKLLAAYHLGNAEVFRGELVRIIPKYLEGVPDWVQENASFATSIVLGRAL